MSMDDLTGPIQWPESKPRQRRTPKRMLEDSVKKDCLKLLARLQKHGSVRLYERRNVLNMATTDGGRIMAGVRGRADIWAVVVCIDGQRDYGGSHQQHVEIECKRRDGKGRASPAQVEFEGFCKRSGIPYVIVTSADDLAAWLCELEVEVPDACRV